MLDRFERIFRIVCLALAAVLVFEFARLFLRADPLANLNIPQLPVLPASTNTNTGTAVATNSAAPQTNSVAKSTNAVVRRDSATNSTNSTNTIAAAISGTNSTNAAATNSTTPTNIVAGTNPPVADTNALVRRGGPRRGGPPMGMPGMPPGMMGGMRGPPLPAPIQVRVDKIVDSEILGPVMHPQPEGLIGIADNEAFIRAPDGQTGPVKVGGTLGAVKLLRIGVNRVLIEENGEKRELTLFGGVGGQSLMPKSTNASTNQTVQSATNTASTNQTVKTAQTDQPKIKETH